MICPICNKEHQPTDAFCPTCDYEIHILPGNLSDAVRKYEETREKNYREIWKALYDSKTASQRAETLNKEIQHALDNKQEELAKTTIQNKDLANQLSQAHYEISQLHSQIKEKQEDKGTIQKLKGQISDYLDQRALLNKEKEEWKFKSNEWESKYNRLFADMSEAQSKISQLQSQLQSVTAEKARLEAALSKINNPQTSNTNSTNPQPSSHQNRGERKGEVIFTDGQHTIKQDVYSGNNVYKTPQSLYTNLRGDLFAIVEDSGGFTIYDRCGSLKKASGRGVGEKGEQIFNGDVFNIGSIQIQIELPDINLDDINF